MALLDLFLRLFRGPVDLFDLGCITPSRAIRTRDPLDLSASGDGVPRRPCHDLTGEEGARSSALLLALREGRGRYPSLAEPRDWAPR